MYIAFRIERGCQLKVFFERPAEVVGVAVAVFVGHAFDRIGSVFEQAGAVPYAQRVEEKIPGRFGIRPGTGGAGA